MEQKNVRVVIHTAFIKLEAAMKLANATESGGMAKAVIQEGLVFVNGQVCTMRGKKLYPGDTFIYADTCYLVCNHETT